MADQERRLVEREETEMEQEFLLGEINSSPGPESKGRHLMPDAAKEAVIDLEHHLNKIYREAKADSRFQTAHVTIDQITLMLNRMKAIRIRIFQEEPTPNFPVDQPPVQP